MAAPSSPDPLGPTACPGIERLATPEPDAALRRHLDRCERCRRERARLRAERPTVRLGPSPGGGTPEVRIDGYTLQRELHRGGQGVVYEAIHDATHRRVALKLLLHGALASDRQRYRFEREIELVASLFHPNVVTVFDSGVSGGGRPYYSMRYVEGRPLDVWLRGDGTGAPSLRMRLELFAKVGSAVGHAHERGVIHRDLKPGNILVDDDGEPHVLDFGLARAAGARTLSGGDPVTRTGEFVGTLAYASPEQTRGGGADVDTRSDVYSLGVILYEMLAGELPYAVDGELAAVLHAITDVEPVPPSSRLRRRDGSAERLDGELDTIVMTALAKERGRRYSSAVALQRDVEHYLAGEPIDAEGDRPGYVLRKLVRRYRWTVAVVALNLALVVGYSISATVLMHRARRSADTQERALQFLKNTLEVSDPTIAAGEAYTLRRALDRAVAMLDRDLRDEPELALEMLEFLGGIYRSLGHGPEAAGLRERALRLRRDGVGGSPRGLFEALHALAGVYKDEHRHDDAERLYREALELADDGAAADPMSVAHTENNLAVVLRRQGRLDAAERRYRRALELYREHGGAQDVAAGLSNLSRLLHVRGDLDAAESTAREALAIALRAGEPSGPSVATKRAALADVLADRGRLDEALELHELALAERRRILRDHPLVARSLQDVACVHERSSAPHLSVPLYEEAVAIVEGRYGAQHWRSARARARLATGRLALGELAAAVALLRESHDGLVGRLGEHHPESVRVAAELADATARLDRRPVPPLPDVDDPRVRPFRCRPDTGSTPSERSR